MSKSLKKMPQFTAEASIYSTKLPYYVHGMYQRSAERVYLADYVDQACLSGCLENCGVFCAGTSGQGKAACISLCDSLNEECEASCTLPGDPPGGNGGNPCAPGTPCSGGCCPVGSTCGSVGGTAVCCPPGFPVACAGGTCCSAGSVCSTVVGTTTTVCCPTAFPVARAVPFLGIRCFPF
jgi:hypothetical protein